MEENNVYQLRQGRALFTPEIRQQIANRIQPVTEKPEEVTDRVEEVLCTVIVGAVRGFGAKLGEMLGEKLGKKVGKATTGEVRNIK